MFTGLIEKTGVIVSRDINQGSGKLSLELEETFDGIIHGESIAVNGVCLTVEEFDENTISFHVLEETFKKTNLGDIEIGGKVNIERALALGDRLGGHMVSGHVDTTSEIKDWIQIGNDWELSVLTPESIQPYLVEKGSIAIDGVSLTVVRLDSDSFCVHIIPTTLDETALFDRKKGDSVNLEADIIGKYVFKQISAYNGGGESNISMDTLTDAGW